MDDRENNSQSNELDQTELDEIDRFLDTLHIPEETIGDMDRPVTTLRTKPPVTIANIFPLLAWVVFLVAMFTIIQAAPQGESFFNNILHVSASRQWDDEHLFAAMCYLFGNCAVCGGGLAIRFCKKMRFTSSGTINLIAAGVLSAVISVILLFQ
ncbi:MAG: hypothetical protein LBR76_04680 [Oscillospiraceae bacterium]|jgi:hypothetical protein|nr:hypothetical protein [Oscillospiraceae bacterium]